MKKTIAAAALTLGATGCLGPNHLSNNLINWNAEITGNSFANEIIFLGLNILPVYGFAYMGDVLIVNSIDFWSDNPVPAPGDFPESYGM